MNLVKLNKGKAYRLDNFSFVRWSDGQEHDGYNSWNYFSIADEPGSDPRCGIGSGVYLGPDEFGIEPIFTDN